MTWNPDKKAWKGEPVMLRMLLHVGVFGGRFKKMTWNRDKKPWEMTWDGDKKFLNPRKIVSESDVQFLNPTLF